MLRLSFSCPSVFNVNNVLTATNSDHSDCELFVRVLQNNCSSRRSQTVEYKIKQKSIGYGNIGKLGTYIHLHFLILIDIHFFKDTKSLGYFLNLGTCTHTQTHMNMKRHTNLLLRFTLFKKKTKEINNHKTAQ